MHSMIPFLKLCRLGDIVIVIRDLRVLDRGHPGVILPPINVAQLLYRSVNLGIFGDRPLLVYSCFSCWLLRASRNKSAIVSSLVDVWVLQLVVRIIWHFCLAIFLFTMHGMTFFFLLGRYLAELLAERQKLAPFMQVLPFCNRLLNQGKFNFLRYVPLLFIYAIINSY